MVKKEKTMESEKMKKIERWFKDVQKHKLEMQDKLAIAGITMEMLEKLEPIYDKYNANDKKYK